MKTGGPSRRGRGGVWREEREGVKVGAREDRGGGWPIPLRNLYARTHAQRTTTVKDVQGTDELPNKPTKERIKLPRQAPHSIPTKQPKHRERDPEYIWQPRAGTPAHSKQGRRGATTWNTTEEKKRTTTQLPTIERGNQNTNHSTHTHKKVRRPYNVL